MSRDSDWFEPTCPECGAEGDCLPGCLLLESVSLEDDDPDRDACPVCHDAVQCEPWCPEGARAAAEYYAAVEAADA